MYFRFIFSFLLLVFLSSVTANESPDLQWSYDGADGPEFWPDTYPDCGGSSQSPINIDTVNTAANYSWSSFTFLDYDVIPSSMNLKNSGHSAQVSVALSSPPTLSGGGLGSDYTFSQLHFHWGKYNWVGSEHKVDGNSYPIELHMVHNKVVKDGSSLKQGDNIAVLGILFEISPSDNPNLTSIIDGLDSIQIALSETSITPFAIGDLLPDNKDDFYRYMGSLTTPPCNETVVWTVFQTPVSISEQQLLKFRNLQFEDGLPMEDNFRPEQALNNRTVYHAILN